MKIPQEVIDSISTKNVEKNDSIEIRKESFKRYLIDDNHTIDQVIDRYLLFGTPYVFENDEETFFALKADIADYLNIKQTQIYVVGSAKLGFSIAPGKLFKNFDDDSDIDIAIIDDVLYLERWRLLYKYYPKIMRSPHSEEEDNIYDKFKDYFFRGWLRPDLFPMKYKQEWFDYFVKLNRIYKYRIAAGIYRDFGFFSDYHSGNLKKLRNSLREDDSKND